MYKPIINPSNACANSDVGSNVFLLFIVKTKPENFLKRKSIRKTWGDQERFPNIRTVFSIGVPKASHTMVKLKRESKTYKDILLMDYRDTYYNLTLKTTSGINWAVAHCNVAEFVVSVDDDMYVATDFLIQHLKRLPQGQAERLYLGHVYEDTLPIRKENSNEYTQKWVIDEDEYSFSTYPNYVFGGFIILSMRTVVEMYTIIPYTKTIVMEDVYVGILASRLGIVPIHTDLVDVYVTYSNSEKFKTLMASHFYKSSAMLRKAWECHLSIVDKDIEKAVFCTYLKDELESVREHIDNILYWIDMSNNAV
ncbi:lactosylceramide 1,3-N-acetyl-beta-D-glucosaminyltransferase B-like [Pecten maximus]|uniref:lactosylceramide 1,3-N-acetyl-beta-D-glucosaminyltransferase B-like n=1 Tax=Pecten maximus TaxID=6579 RepID=UPI00145810B4|nr:lactosylceramide 1,3-N-acetyl-beta-D-glucosaminyltransferase B-like [Pecten maximus]